MFVRTLQCHRQDRTWMPALFGYDISPDSTDIPHAMRECVGAIPIIGFQLWRSMSLRAPTGLEEQSGKPFHPRYLVSSITAQDWFTSLVLHYSAPCHTPLTYGSIDHCDLPDVQSLIRIQIHRDTAVAAHTQCSHDDFTLD